MIAWTRTKTAIVAGVIVVLAGTAIVAVRTFSSSSITLKNAYVRLYSSDDYAGAMLTILPQTASPKGPALRGDISNLDGVPSDNRELDSFNDKTASAAYLLPKGWSVILFEHANFDGQQYKLVGTGKPEAIPSFKHAHPAFSEQTSSLRWVPE